MAKRIKEVFDGSMVAHLWANASQLSARNPQGNISFGGGDLRSYSTVIARRLKVKDTIVFLHSIETWSVTTSKHQQGARQASNGPGRESFTVSDIHADTYAAHKANVLNYLTRATDTFTKAQRARTNGEWLTNSALALVTSAQRYAALFNVRGVKFPDAANLADLATQAAERQAKANKQASTAKRKAQKLAEERAALLMTALPDLIAQWRAGDNNPSVDIQGHKTYYTPYNVKTLNNGSDLMRLMGEDVETIQGAHVPARIVRRMAPFVLGLMAECGDSVDPVYATARFPGKTLHVGHFQIQYWNCKRVWVGCHTFTRDEVAHILDVLQRAEIVPSEDTAAPTDNV